MPSKRKNLDNVGIIVRQRCLERGLSLKALALKIEVSQNSIYRLLRGDAKLENLEFKLIYELRLPRDLFINRRYERWEQKNKEGVS